MCVCPLDYLIACTCTCIVELSVYICPIKCLLHTREAVWVDLCTNIAHVYTRTCTCAGVKIVVDSSAKEADGDASNGDVSSNGSAMLSPPINSRVCDTPEPEPTDFGERKPSYLDIAHLDIRDGESDVEDNEQEHAD